jgi:ribonuclease HII
LLNSAVILHQFSKTLSQRQRDTALKIMRQIPKSVQEMEIAPISRVDTRVAKGELNELTIDMVHAILHRLLARLEPTDECRVVLDSLSSDTKTYSMRYDDVVTQYKNARVQAYTKADRDFKVVGAASIIAKTERERQIAEIKKSIDGKVIGDFGSGYPGDARMVKFLKENWGRPELKDICRQSWKPWREMMQKMGGFHAGL